MCRRNLPFSLQVDESLSLRLPTESDVPELFALFDNNRSHLTEWQEWPNKIQTPEDCRELILRYQYEYKDGASLRCVMVFNNQLIGMCTLSSIVAKLEKGNLGYWIAAEHQGKGIVAKSCRALIAHAFDGMNLNRLSLDFKRENENRENVRSREIAERLGFTQEGILRQAGMTKGHKMDMVICSLLAEEWRDKKKQNKNNGNAAAI